MFKEVKSGEFIIATTSIFMFKGEGKKDISLQYDIIDSQGKKFVESSKTIAVATHISELQKLELPEVLMPGKYTLKLEATPLEKEGEKQKTLKATESFKVVEQSTQNSPNIIKFIFYLKIIILILIITAVYLMYRLLAVGKKRIHYGTL